MMEDRWVDYQMVFSQRFQLTRRISLEEALGRADIDPEGIDFQMEWMMQ